MMATTIKVVLNKVVSIEPNASNKSAKIPPGPVTWESTPATEAFISSRIKSIINGSAGSSPIFSAATFASSWTFMSAAFPSVEGIACNGAPCAK